MRKTRAQVRDGEKFLGYLPEGGMEEQREGLRNAMVLGRLLNRTVLVPPLWVGTVRSSEGVYETLVSLVVFFLVVRRRKR